MEKRYSIYCKKRYQINYLFHIFIAVVTFKVNDLIKSKQLTVSFLEPLEEEKNFEIYESVRYYKSNSSIQVTFTTGLTVNSGKNKSAAP